MASAHTILIKFGGNSLSGPGDLDRFAAELAGLIERGYRPILVHGGGPEISREMERRGMAVRKAAGLRITDEAALAVAAEVLSGINAATVDMLRGRGIDAVGVSAAEAGVVCTRKPPVTIVENGVEAVVDLDRVGDVIDVAGNWLQEAVASGTVPVIYPIGADDAGLLYNVNADTMAAFVAQASGAEAMVLLTDVPGILRGGETSSEVVHDITFKGIDELIAQGVITGGMLPKVEACRDAIRHSVPVVHMLNGREPNSMARKLIGHERIGTTVTQG
jgi:acetylglutamate kinase